MAGSSQAANLSGMLSQIGGTIGGMGKAGDALVRPLENTFRPDVDPNDPDSLRRLMQWQQGIGREDAARTTMMQAERLAEKQQEEKVKKEGQARAMAISQYEKALQVGDPDAIAAAEDAVRKVGEAQGIDVTGLLAGVEQRSFAQTNQAYQEQERIRLGQERVREAAEDRMVNQLAVAMNGASSIEQLDALLESAPVEAAAQANVLYERATTRIDKAQKRLEAEQEAKAPIQKIELALPEQGIPEDMRKSYSRRADVVNKEIEDLNVRIANGEAINPKVEKQRLAARRNALENQMYQIADSVVLGEYRDKRKEEQAADKQIRDIELAMRAPFSNNDAIRQEARAIAGVDRDGKPLPVTSQHLVQAKRKLIQERNSAYASQIRMLRGETDEQPTGGMTDDGGFSVKVNGKVTTAAMVSDAVAAIGESATRARLKAEGVSDQQIEALLGNVRGGYGGTLEYRVRQADMASVQSTRDKISPMGTYTQ